eukprot:5831754-Pyramimonas_sp.AAC.1
MRHHFSAGQLRGRDATGATRGQAMNEASVPLTGLGRTSAVQTRQVGAGPPQLIDSMPPGKLHCMESRSTKVLRHVPVDGAR